MVKIKQLAWSDFPNVGWVANCVVGHFVVAGGRWTLKVAAGNGPRQFASPYYRDDDTAKAAAQAHFESLIRSTLEE